MPNFTDSKDAIGPQISKMRHVTITTSLCVCTRFETA